MNKIRYFGCFLLIFSAFFTPVLWADRPVLESTGNTQTVESLANTISAQVSPSLPETLVSPQGTPSTQASFALPEVVVTANRLDTPANEVTSSLSVITAKELKQKQAGTILDAIQGIPGLDVAQSGNPGQNASVFIRGTNPEHTLVLMDGIPLNDPVGTSSSYDYLDGLSLEDVKQVEVVCGPQSTLWGSNAMGGVINIISQSDPAPLGGSVLMEGGSYGTSHEAVGAQGGDNGGYFNLNGSHYNTAGFPVLDVKGLDAADASREGPNEGLASNGDDNNTASLRLGSNLTSNLQENFSVRYSQSNTSLDAYNSNYVLADDPNYFALQKQFMAASHTNLKLLEGNWEQVLNVSFFDDNRAYIGVANPYNTYYEQGSFDGQMAQINWQNNIHLAKEETLVLGIQGQEQWAVSADASGYTDLGPNSPDAVPVTTVQAKSAFVESQTSIDDRLFFNLGGRLEDNSQFGTHTTYQAGLAYFVPVLETKLKANYGTGFLAPSLYQLYDPTFGNPNLLPETSVGYDFGFEQVFGKGFLNIGAGYFDNDLTNLIQFQSTFPYLPFNVGQARTYGFEASAEFKGVQNLAVKGSYTYTNAQNLITQTPLIRRPQNKANVDMDYQLGKIGFGTSLIYVGTSLDSDFSGTSVTLPGYFLANLRVSYQLNSQVKLFGRINNLFSQWYEEIYGYRTQGLSAYVGTQVSI